MPKIAKYSRKISLILILVGVFGLGVFAGITNVAASPQLGISGDKFTIDGQEKFLLGVSYFDARNWKKSDFQKLQENGFNLIRIWLDWPKGYDLNLDWRYFNSYFDASGNITYEQDLLDLVRAAGRYGIIVDVTILQGRSFGGDFTLRTTAVQNAVRVLGNEPNVLFDIMNEHNNAQLEEITIAQAGKLIAAGKSENPAAIFTVSGGDRYYSTTYPNFTLKSSSADDDIDIDDGGGVDLLSPHFPRGCDWGVDAGNRVSAIKNYITSIGKNIPIYVQEENRRKWGLKDCTVFRTHGGDFPNTVNSDDYNLDFPYKSDFLTSAKRSKDAGAAAWLFHTQAGFDMRTNDFFSQLDSIEQEIVRDLRYIVYGNSSTVDLIDPLNGSTSGNVTGGQFIAGGGWKTVAKTDKIVFELPEPINGPGYAEVEVVNFNPGTQCGGVQKSDFFALYDGAHGNTATAGIHEFSTRAMFRIGTNYGDNIKVKGSPGIYDGWEVALNLPAFNPQHTYKFRMEWDENDIWWNIDGAEIKRVAFGSLANYSIKYIFLGRDGSPGSDYGTCPGPIYKNFRVYSAGSAPAFDPADINSDGSVNSQDVMACVNVILELETDSAIIAKAKAVVLDVEVCNSQDLMAIVNEILK